MSNFQQNYKISEETGKYTIYTGKKKKIANRKCPKSGSLSAMFLKWKHFMANKIWPNLKFVDLYFPLVKMPFNELVKF